MSSTQKKKKKKSLLALWVCYIDCTYVNGEQHEFHMWLKVDTQKLSSLWACVHVHAYKALLLLLFFEKVNSFNLS